MDMIYIRSFIFNVLFYLTILLGCIIAVALGLFVPRRFHWWWWNDCVLVFLRKMMQLICGMEIEVRGKNNIRKGAAIYASKHQSAVETYFMSSIIKNATFIFKKELTHIPFFGWAIRFYGSVPVDRSGKSKAMKKMLSDAKALLKIGMSIIIFPEGTRTQPGKNSAYKPGVFFLYENTDVPLIPVALNSAFFWKKNSFLRHPGKIIIEFLEPMPKGLDKQEFMSELKRRIEDKCNQLNQETIKNYPETKSILQ